MQELLVSCGRSTNASDASSRNPDNQSLQYQTVAPLDFSATLAMVAAAAMAGVPLLISRHRTFQAGRQFCSHCCCSRAQWLR
jgi:hypothetical protein